MMTPLVRLISSSARRTSGFFCNAVSTACSTVNLGAPLSDQPRSPSASAADRAEIGAVGDGLAVENEGTDTVPASVGVMVAVTLGIGVGVGVDTSIGVGCGVSVGVGVCARDNAAVRNAARPNPATKNCF